MPPLPNTTADLPRRPGWDGDLYTLVLALSISLFLWMFLLWLVEWMLG
jgi:hypothetical protein